MSFVFCICQKYTDILGITLGVNIEWESQLLALKGKLIDDYYGLIQSKISNKMMIVSTDCSKCGVLLLSQTHNKRGKSIFSKKYYEFPMFIGKTDDEDVTILDLDESKQNFELADNLVVVCIKCDPITRDQTKIIENIKVLYKFMKEVRIEARKIKYYKQYKQLKESSDDCIEEIN